MHRIRRRGLLSGSSALASLWLAGGAPPAHAAAPASLIRDPKGILDLPAGFTYKVVSRSGERMHDGYFVPGNPDAMAVFKSGDAWALMRNHEIPPGAAGMGPYPQGMTPPKAAYDPQGYGGVTRVVIDPRTLALRSSNLALAGTHWNCAGGTSPWGWLSCEEIFVPGHGYVFLVPTDAAQLTPARRIVAYGRFRHEAATVDPKTSIAFLTEDREDAAFYRFLPDDPAQPFKGRLQALRVLGQPRFDTNQMTTGESHSIDWVNIPEADPREDNVRYQAFEHGAARFVRSEGIWLNGPDLYMCATAGGPIGRGQIFRVTHRGSEMRLTLLVQSSDPSILDMPDNITVAPNGQLFVAEDGLGGNFIRRITPDGQVCDFARNARSVSEFSGPCFAPDGSTLFVNIQHDGLTLAVRGPFDQETAGRASASEADGSWPLPRGAAGVSAGLAVLALAALGRRKRNPT